MLPFCHVLPGVPFPNIRKLCKVFSQTRSLPFSPHLSHLPPPPPGPTPSGDLNVLTTRCLVARRATTPRERTKRKQQFILGSSLRRHTPSFLQDLWVTGVSPLLCVRRPHTARTTGGQRGGGLSQVTRFSFSLNWSGFRSIVGK